VLYLLEAYGVTDLPKLTFADDVEGEEVAWTVGLALRKSLELAPGRF
jgi:hypothetical protein